MSDKGQQKDTKVLKTQSNTAGLDSFVLEKTIFSNVFDKDIKRVYIYKKAERLAKAIHLIAPAFRSSPSLYDRVNRLSIALVDAAILPPVDARDGLSRELLALSSILAIGRTSGMLSPMNADLVSREAHLLLEEVAGYEEPRLVLPEAPTLAELAKVAPSSFTFVREGAGEDRANRQLPVSPKGQTKGHVKDSGEVATPAAVASASSRREAIISVLRTKGPSYIKDLSTVIRDVSEKTIQRELAALVSEGVVTRTGERRWTTYTLAG